MNGFEKCNLKITYVCKYMRRTDFKLQPGQHGVHHFVLFLTFDLPLTILHQLRYLPIKRRFSTPIHILSDRRFVYNVPKLYPTRCRPYSNLNLLLSLQPNITTYFFPFFFFSPFSVYSSTVKYGPQFVCVRKRSDKSDEQSSGTPITLLSCSREDNYEASVLLFTGDKTDYYGRERLQYSSRSIQI